jgi:hypothetical protein
VQKQGADSKSTAVAQSPAAKGVRAKAEAEAESAAEPNILSVFSATTAGAIVAFAGLALGLLAAFTLARRREQAADAGRRRRDISALSLDGRQARGRAGANARGRAGRPGAPPPPQQPPGAGHAKTAVGPARSAGDRGVAASWGDRMPRTREEALEVLGIGIAPSATDTAIKKIVDGLRMSWHPDLAKDETDRLLRELRSKQINAAWDILHAQRAVV